jgi:hypothetical protein
VLTLIAQTRFEYRHVFVLQRLSFAAVVVECHRAAQGLQSWIHFHRRKINFTWG